MLTKTVTSVETKGNSREQSVDPSDTSTKYTDLDSSPETVDVGCERKGQWNPEEDRELSRLIKVRQSILWPE
jgi:hypothetical protein